jgi:hypothetical protein
MLEILPLIFGLAFLVFIFWVCRGLALWYWKVSEIVRLLEDIKKNTAKSDNNANK